MKRRPLTDVFAPRTRIFDLIRRDACKVVGRDVANAITARLDRMHFHARKQREDVRYGFELRPVVLQILTRREVTEALVVFARDPREHAHLAARQEAVWNRDPQHRRKTLNVQAIA